MRLNTLEKLYWAMKIELRDNYVRKIRLAALRPIQRMLEMSAKAQQLYEITQIKCLF